MTDEERRKARDDRITARLHEIDQLPYPDLAPPMTLAE